MRAVSLLVLLCVSCAVAPRAFASDEPGLRVALDHARVLRIARPAETIIIGNPAIADIAIHDAKTLILTGRSYGITNVVVLDAAGEVVIDDSVQVTSDEDGTLRVFRQSMRSTYSCSPECEPRLTIGDSETTFESAGSQFNAREGMVGGSSAPAPAGGN